MKKRLIITGLSALVALSAAAQTGAPYIHDPSTIQFCDGKYYTFGTGGGGLISVDGWVWEGGAVRPGGGAAPDAIRIGDRYLVGYSATGGGLGGGHAGRVLTMWNRTLDPSSPDFAFTEPVEVARSEVDEDCDAIDVGFLMDPSGRLFCTYGTYFGNIRMVELDPATGGRLPGNRAVDVAIDCEASTMMYRDGWYYLLGTHGTCCDGVNSTYNIVCGRSRSPFGPFLDNVGRDMRKGGGKMVVAAEERRFGAGHFGRFIVEPGVEKMSFHFEADLDRSGRSVLAVRPILWKEGWPEAGELVQDGTYKIISRRRGYALELAVDFVRAQGGMRGFWMKPDEPVVVLEGQKLSDVEATWPDGDIPVRAGDYMARPHQKWVIEAVPGAGGFLGGPYCRILVEGTERALAVTEGAGLVTVPAFTGADGELWRIEQLTDGTWRILPKSVPGSGETLCLGCIADSTPALLPFDFTADNCKWDLKMIR
ncbi:MAG: family 43 glycosylhydrolase [Bacteroidales bacterium]|nr:family 43 glycosylhydrolase [Bacteroidales bacterium]